MQVVSEVGLPEYPNLESTGAAEVNFDADRNVATALSMPVGVTFFGTAYDSVFLFEDGFTSFTDASITSLPSEFPSANAPNAVVTVCGGVDFNTTLGGKVFAGSYTSPISGGQYIIEFVNVPLSSNPYLLQSFQIVFFESADLDDPLAVENPAFQIRVKNVSVTFSDMAAVGFENPAGEGDLITALGSGLSNTLSDTTYTIFTTVCHLSRRGVMGCI